MSTWAVTGVAMGLVTGSDREVYVTWNFNHLHVKEFQIHWEYYTGTTYTTKNKAGKVVTKSGAQWFVGNDTTSSGYTNKTIAGKKQYADSWTAPANATKVRVTIKPFSTTHKVKHTKIVKKKKTTYETNEVYWKGKWSTQKELKLSSVISKAVVSGAPSNLKLIQQGSSGRTVMASWSFTGSGVTGYEVEWQYTTNGKNYLNGSTSTVTTHAATYDVPENASEIAVRVRIVKDAGQGPWTKWLHWNTSNLHPSAPSTPTVSLNNNTLNASIDNYTASRADKIRFQIVLDNKQTAKTLDGKLAYGRASIAFTTSSGHSYKVRCQAVNGTNLSDWSEYSEIVYSLPAPPGNFTSCVALSESQVKLTWPVNSYADSYTIEYANKSTYFDTSPNNVQSVSGLTTGTAIIDVESGHTWYFRCKAVRDSIESGWNKIISISTGKKPAEPTTWSLTSTAGVGDIIKFYWVHNSQDNSSQVAAQLDLRINGVSKIITVKNNRPEDEKDEVSEYAYNTSSLTEGAVIEWRVRTKGVLPTYSDWSIVREIKVYATPVLYFESAEERKWIWDTFNFEEDLTSTALSIPEGYPETLESLPIFICARAEPSQQTPIRYSIVITALEDYEVAMDDGTTSIIKAQEEVFNKVYYPFDYDAFKNYLFASLSASNISLENNVGYMLMCTVVMDSGLTASHEYSFVTAWEDSELYPNASVSTEDETFTATITPYCEDDLEQRVDDVFLSVYRRNFDGTFTEIAKNLYGANNTTVTDPHPALDYARYRIIAKDLSTGKVTYEDLEGEEIGESSIIIQWDEDWRAFDELEEDAFLDEAEWSGSILKLPFNIDISEDHAPDVEFVEYIGRRHPVSYYGTQTGETATWNTSIDIEDTETLYDLRRLAVYMGDCYVREPSGSGYWANVSVSISKTHRETSIPITLSLTRVEGSA